MDILSEDHLLFDEFLSRLNGLEGCAVREEDGQIRWDCDGRFTQATRILGSMRNVDVAATLAYFEQSRAFCDCEILFNLDQEF